MVDNTGRARTRIGTSQISVRFVSEGNEATGVLRDVSRQGAYIRASQIPRPGAVIAIQFEDTDGKLIEARGEVRWNVSPNGDQPSGFGVIVHEPSRRFRDFVDWALNQSNEKGEDDDAEL